MVSNWNMVFKWWNLGVNECNIVFGNTCGSVWIFHFSVLISPTPQVSKPRSPKKKVKFGWSGPHLSPAAHLPYELYAGLGTQQGSMGSPSVLGRWQWRVRRVPNTPCPAGSRQEGESPPRCREGGPGLLFLVVNSIHPGGFDIWWGEGLPSPPIPPIWLINLQEKTI